MVRHLLSRATRLRLYACAYQATEKACAQVLQHALPQQLRKIIQGDRRHD